MPRQVLLQLRGRKAPALIAKRVDHSHLRRRPQGAHQEPVPTDRFRLRGKGLGDLLAEPVQLFHDHARADPRVALVLDVLSRGTSVRANALVEFDKVQELEEVLRFDADSVSDEFALTEPAQVHEEVEDASVGHRAGVERQRCARVDVLGVADLPCRQEGVEQGHEVGEEVTSLDHFFMLKAANQAVPEELMKFGTTVKKKGHEAYGAFYKDTADMKKATKITFD
ncbi:RNA-dependent ATPase [Friedmanniomyces endolithicus]|nr:RNA-dependent ATPase [Friedmanniomyces endolithicus]